MPRWTALPDCSPRTNYTASMTFTNTGLDAFAMSVAFDGTNFWVVSGNFSAGNRLARYSATGVLDRFPCIGR